MPLHWHILADDLTGALDTAAAWADAEAVPVFLDMPGPSVAKVQVVSTGSRDVEPDTLPARLTPSLDWFTASGQSFKKIDSLLRGNTFAEIAWLMRSGRFNGAVLAPAFPAQGRYTAQGRHWVAPPGQPQGGRSHEHPVTLMQALSEVGLDAHLPSRIADCLDHPGCVVVPDLLDDHDLDELAALASSSEARHWLWCGSAGLAWALSRRARHGAAHPTNEPPHPQAVKPRLLLLTASRHPVLREQLRHLPALDATVELIDLAVQQPLSPAEAHTRLEQDVQDIVTHHPKPDRLVVVGGDTLLAVCRAAKVDGLLAGPSPRPGWGQARLLGGTWDGLACYARSGAFGPPDDLHKMLASLTPPPHFTLETPT